jgi:hypothetical protein
MKTVIPNKGRADIIGEKALRLFPDALLCIGEGRAFIDRKSVFGGRARHRQGAGGFAIVGKRGGARFQRRTWPWASTSERHLPMARAM